jgi:hypothetical protein
MQRNHAVSYSSTLPASGPRRYRPCTCAGGLIDVRFNSSGGPECAAFVRPRRVDTRTLHCAPSHGADNAIVVHQSIRG